MRASSQKCIMQPPILQMQQRTMAAQIFHKARNRYFFSCFLHFGGTFLPLFWCVCRHLFPILPSPKEKLISLCSCKSHTKRKTQPALFTPSLSLTHTCTFFPCKQMNGSVCSHRPLSTPPLAREHHSPAAPSSALTYLDIVGEIGP